MSPLRGLFTKADAHLDALSATLLNPLRTILDPAHEPEAAWGVFWRLAFGVLAFDALLSFILALVVGVVVGQHSHLPAAAAEETLSILARVRGCSIAYTVVCGTCFLVGLVLLVRIDYFRNSAVPPLPLSRRYVPPGAWIPDLEAEEVEARVSASTFYSMDPKVSDARDHSVDLPRAGLSELDGASIRRVASPQGLQQSSYTTVRNSYQYAPAEADVGYDSFRNSSISPTSRPSLSPLVSPDASPLILAQQHAPSKAGRAKSNIRGKHSFQKSESGSRDKLKGIDKSSRPNSCATAISATTSAAGGRRSEDARATHDAEIHSDTRHYSEVAGGPSSQLRASVRSTAEGAYHPAVVDSMERSSKYLSERMDERRRRSNTHSRDLSHPQPDWI